MKYRTLLLAGVALNAGFANGMGLGKVNLHSYLGYPLDAHINLLSTQDYGLQDVKVQLADAAVFERMGVRHSPDHSNLRFSVTQNEAGELLVKMSTGQRFVEPFLDVVVELTWPAGTTYRHYNLLLDPPEYAQRWRADPKPVEPAMTLLATELAAEIEPTLSKSPVSMAKPPVSGGEYSGEAYKVQLGDSLWTLSSAANRPVGLSRQAMMTAIFEHNPHAFINGNRNRLKAGAILQLPARSNVIDPLAPPSVMTVESAVAEKVDVQSLVDDNARLTAEVTALREQLAQLEQEKVQWLARQERIKSRLAALKSDESVTEPATAESPIMTPLSSPAQKVASERVDQRIPVANTPVQSLLTQKEKPLAEAASTSSGVWFLLAVIPLGVLASVMGFRARRVHALQASDSAQDSGLHDVVFGSRRKIAHSDEVDGSEPVSAEEAAPAEVLPQTAANVTNLTEKQAERVAQLPKADVLQMAEMYQVYHQYQNALDILLPKAQELPDEPDLQLCLLKVYAKLGDWDHCDEQMAALERLKAYGLLQEARAIYPNARLQA